MWNLLATLLVFAAGMDQGQVQPKWAGFCQDMV